MDLDSHLERIRTDRQGPDVAAFFDFDGTIVQGYSAHVLYTERLRRREIGPGEIVRAVRAGLSGPMTEQSFEAFIVDGISNWAGRPAEYHDNLAQALYRNGIAASLFHEAWRLIKAHQEAGHTVVIASSATRLQIEAMATELGIHDILCTELESVDGVFTGRLAGRTLWGAGKEAAIAAFARERCLDLDDSYGYANGDEDIPFLSRVGHPFAVNPQPALANVAQAQGWPVFEFTERPGRLAIGARVRTSAMWASIVAAGAAGLAVSAVTRDRWRGINLMTQSIARLGAAAGGIDIEVQGKEHLWSHRPAVFMINHQSGLVDLIVGASLVHERTAALVKNDVREIPLVGALMSWAQMAFVDDTRSTQAQHALAEAIQRLDEGISIILAPEGARSYSPTIGPFMHEGFHLARAVGAPIVPIVLRNCGQLMPRGSKVAAPGTVQALVLSPISTAGWTEDDVDAEARQLQQRYLDVLTHWPASGADAAPADDAGLPSQLRHNSATPSSAPASAAPPQPAAWR